MYSRNKDIVPSIYRTDPRAMCTPSAGKFRRGKTCRSVSEFCKHRVLGHASQRKLEHNKPSRSQFWLLISTFFQKIWTLISVETFITSAF